MSILSLQYTPDEIAQLRATIRQRMLSDSPYVRQENFTRLHPQDVLLLYRLYDKHFLAGKLQPLVTTKCGKPLLLKVSRAMTRSGGSTTQHRQRTASGPRVSHYRITISSGLLFNSFLPNSRPIHVAGCECTDRLDAMMRIMEHELVHLIEMLTFGGSSCSRTRFLTIAQRLFGHTHKAHRLVSSAERAAMHHQLKPGDQVRFVHDGRQYQGMLNRVSVRATVLVPDTRGRRYSDGQHYIRFYVPVLRLQKA